MIIIIHFGRQLIRVCLALILSGVFALGAAPILGADAAPGNTPREQDAVTAGFHVSGRFLLDGNGNNFIMRGINHPHAWFPNETSAFKNIKAKGANTVRVVLSNGKLWPQNKNSASNVQNVISLCKTNKLVCVLEVHDTTGYGQQAGAATLAQAVAYWKEIKNVLIGQEAYVIINLGNEPYGNINPSNGNPIPTDWINATKNAIAEMRNAGFQHMLMVDAPSWGQDASFVMRDNAASVFASDPNKNTVFSIHMFGVFDTPKKVNDYIAYFVNAGLPLVIGEFGHMHTFGNPDEDAIMSAAQANGIGYMGWSWSKNSADVSALDMVAEFNPNLETWWGKRIIRGPNGICRTSVEASIYGGNRDPMLCAIEYPGTLPISSSAATFNAIFSEAVTGVDISDFTLTPTGVSGAQITGVSGSGLTRTVTVKTAPGNGTIRVNLSDNDTIRDGTNRPLGGAGAGNGNYSFGDTYSVTKPTNLTVHIGGLPKGQYSLPQNESTRQSYIGTNSGPVRIEHLQGSSIIAAERIVFKVNGVNTSFLEMMGLPDNQIDTTYWLPWYNNATADLDTQLRIANVSTSPATVHIFIGGAEMIGSPVTLAVGESTRKSFPGVNNGPVKIESNVNIVAAERVVYKVNNVNTSFSEMMAIPDSQLNTTYWLPWYNNVELDTQLRIANVSTSPATVHVYVGNQEMTGSPFTLGVGESTRKSFPGVNNGPVKIESNVNIVAAERVVYKVNNVNTSFSEMMALPNDQLGKTYWLPWYNNTGDLDTQLRFANVSTSTATVHVYIGEVEMSGSPFTLAPGASTRKSFAGVNNGLVRIVSNQNIVAAERIVYKVNGINTSFSEMMAMPHVALDSVFWLPWYNNTGDLDTQLRFGVP